MSLPFLTDSPASDPVAIAADALLEAIPQAAAVIDRLGQILGTNAAFRSLGGDPVGLEGISRISSGRTTTWHATILRDEQRLIYEWEVRPLPDTAGLMLLSGRDVTETRTFIDALVESRTRFRALLTLTRTFGWETGCDGTFSFITPEGALGYSPRDLLGTDPARLALDAQQGRILFNGLQSIHNVEIWMRDARGHDTLLSVSAEPMVDHRGLFLGMRGICRDMTEDYRRQVALAEQYHADRMARYILGTLHEAADQVHGFEQAAEALVRTVPATGTALFRIDQDNGLTCIVQLGGSLDPAIEQWLRHCSLDQRLLAAEIAGREVLLIPTRRGSECNGLLLVWRQPDHPVLTATHKSFLLSVADSLGVAFAHLDYRQHLEYLSMRDGLTGLLNRRALERTLTRRRGRAGHGTRAGDSMVVAGARGGALLYMDVDNLKSVNDTLGHQAGDRLLVRIARKLQGACGAEDVAARIGGDEFVLWLHDADEDSARQSALDLTTAIEQLATELPVSSLISVSIGIAVAGEGESLSRMIGRADAAMYRAKRQGKAHYVVAERIDGLASSS